MDIRILGPLEVMDGDRVLELGGSRQRAVLARLAVAANRVVAVDALVDELWGPVSPAGAKQALQAQISRVRRSLGDASRLTAQSPGYVLRLEPDELDASRFETLLAQARAAADGGDLGAARRMWTHADTLWRGRALEEFGDYPFAQAEAARLEELRVAAIEARIETDLALGRHGELVAELETLVGAHPFRERLWSHLMLALYRCGRQADALGVYQRVRTILGEELGIPPSPELVRLEDAILRQVPDVAWVPPSTQQPDGRTERPARRARADLPVVRSSFIGRHEEMAELRDMVQQSRLVTLVGPGGIGKTRLAIEVARGLAADGGEVAFVELAALSDPAVVPDEIARACGVREEPDRDPLETLVEALRGGRMLIVLDNCEHLLDAAAAVADSVLAGASEVSILATSRAPLRLDGERVWRPPPLAVPPSAGDVLGFDAARLFVARAIDVDDSFAVTPKNSAAIGLICRRLDGIPLAIELAAGRIGAISAPELAARLDDRFRLLSAGSRSALPRHRTLSAAIEWSYDLCTAAEQTLFRRLSVFGGGFTLAAVEAVCSDAVLPRVDILELLAGLVDRSLVVKEPGTGDARYDLLETLRAFATERLAETSEAATLRDRHLAYYTDLARRADLGIRRARGPAAVGAGQQEWLDLLEIEHDNVRAALLHALEAERAVPLAAVLGMFWELRHHVSEGQSWLSRALARGGGEEGARGRAVNSLGVLHMRSGDYAKAHERFEAALDAAGRLGDDELAAQALTNLAGLAGLRADLPLAQRLNEDALARWRRLDDEYGVAWTLASLSWVAGAQCRLPLARTLQEEAVVIRRRLGDEQGVAWSLASLGRVASEEGEYDDARRYLEESVALCQRLGYRSDMLVALLHLGELERATGNPDRARALLEDSVAMAREHGSRHLLLWALLYLAAVSQDQGDDAEARLLLVEATPLAVALQNRLAVVEILELSARSAVARSCNSEAARLFGTARAIRECIGAPVPPYRQPEFDRAEESIVRELGRPAADTHAAEGHSIGRRALEVDDLGSLLSDVHMSHAGLSESAEG